MLNKFIEKFDCYAADQSHSFDDCWNMFDKMSDEAVVNMSREDFDDFFEICDMILVREAKKRGCQYRSRFMCVRPQ